MLLTTPTALATSQNEPASRFRDCPPVDFDAGAHPIIACHFFGVGPFRPTGEVAAGVVADLTFRRKVERLHALGPRVTAELLAEIGAERSIQTIIDRKLDRFTGLAPEALEIAGGDRFWPSPLSEVPQ